MVPTFSPIKCVLSVALSGINISSSWPYRVILTRFPTTLEGIPAVVLPPAGAGTVSCPCTKTYLVRISTSASLGISSFPTTFSPSAKSREDPYMGWEGEASRVTHSPHGILTSEE